jgi:hypothetical protein
VDGDGTLCGGKSAGVQEDEARLFHVLSLSLSPGFPSERTDNSLLSNSMHGLTSVLFLPPLLEKISPHLRPYLLTSHFRLIVAYWVSRGRPPLFVADTLMAASSRPSPPSSASRPSGTAINRALHFAVRENASRAPSRATSPSHGDSPLTPRAAETTLPFSDANGDYDEQESSADEGTNPWMMVLQSAVDHHDEHVTKVRLSLYFLPSMC